MKNLPVLQFDSTPINLVDYEGIAWVTFNDLVSALYGLTSSNTSVGAGRSAYNAANRVFSANADEFTDAMTRLIKLPIGGQLREVRIFSPRGCHLLAMLAKTPKAKAFRRWVLDVLEGHDTDRVKALEARLAQMIQAIYTDHPFWLVIAACKARGLTHAQTLDATGYRATSTITRNLRRMERYALSQLSLFKH